MEFEAQILSYLKDNPKATAPVLIAALGASRRSLFRHLKTLHQQGQIIKTGSGNEVTYSLNYPSGRPATPALISTSQVKPDLRKQEPPLVNLQVTNPITYLKLWWKRVLGGEGIDFHFRIRPLTAIALTIIIATFGFGVGRISLSTQEPYLKYTPPASPTPTPTPNPWRDTAFSGILRFTSSGNRYYLITQDSEAITLEVPKNVDLNKLIGRRIFATGRYNEVTRTLVVTDTEDLEILPQQPLPLPLTSPTLSPPSSLVPTQP